MNDVNNRFCVVTIRFNDEFPNQDTVVPSSYILKKDGKNFVKFMQPPFTEDDLQCIKSFVESAADPPTDGWKLYECIIKARGPDYNGAIKWMLEKNSVIQTINNNVETTSEEPTAAGDLYDVPATMHSIASTGDEAASSNNVVDAGVNPSLFDKQSFLAEVRAVVREEIKEMKNSVLSRIKFVETELKEVKALVLAQEKKINSDILTYTEFCEAYKDHKFPLTSVEAFDELNKDIINNRASIDTNIVRYFITEINVTVDCSDNMTVILKKMFAKDLLTKYTAQKPKPDKFVFKDTSFYKKIEEAFIKAYSSPEINSTSILKTLSHVFHNVKDWEGGRSQRANKNK